MQVGAPIQRHRQILDALDADGAVSAARLAEKFSVSTETIRRDLDQLAESGLLTRVHGGAVANRTAVREVDLAERSVTNRPQKQAIAALAQQFLPDGGPLLLDAGSTVGAVLPSVRTAGTVITNAIPHASELIGREGIDLRILPGRVRGSTHAAVGADTVDALRRLVPEVALLGCNGMDERGFSTPAADEAAVKRAMVQQARLRIMLADSSKANTHSLHLIAAPSEIDVLITDKALPAHLYAHFADEGIDVIHP